MEDAAEATGSSTSGPRERKQTELFGIADMKLTPSELARFDNAIGGRRERQPEKPCQREDCAHTRRERDAYAQLPAQRAVEIRRLHEEMHGSSAAAAMAAQRPSSCNKQPWSWWMTRRS